jgi:hypothetical protein
MYQQGKTPAQELLQLLHCAAQPICISPTPAQKLPPLSHSAAKHVTVRPMSAQELLMLTLAGVLSSSARFTGVNTSSSGAAAGAWHSSTHRRQLKSCCR